MGDEPVKQAYDMRRYRANLRTAWKAMQWRYSNKVKRPYLLPPGICLCDPKKKCDATWPVLEHFALVQERQRRDQL
jgi:hypothetical protein